MHEMSIAIDIIDTVVEVADQNSATAIEQVDLLIGKMRLVVPHALELAFQIASEGTVAEGAKLVIQEENIKMQCRNCNEQYDAEINNYLCPNCMITDGDFISGNDIILTSVVCTTE